MLKHTAALFLAVLLVAPCTTSCADPLDGTWVLHQSIDYENPKTRPRNNGITTLQIKNKILQPFSKCPIRIHAEIYKTHDLFQLLIKSGESPYDIDKFFINHFDFQPDKTTPYYQADISSPCNKLGDDFIFKNDYFIAIQAGSLFHVFKRIPTTVTSGNLATYLESISITPLPFNIDKYMEHCAFHIPLKRGIPQPTHPCAPLFFPHIASKNSRDSLSKLVGSHHYFKSGAVHGTEDYDNPVANGLHPVFLVFPPLEDVILVRVNDMDRTESRDAISGVYLAIKNDQVTDQLNVGCDFDAKYICSSSESEPKYQLTKNGKFRKLK